MCFMLFLWLCDFLQFLSVKYSKMFTAHRIQRDTNFKHDKSRVCKGSFLDVLETNLKCLSFTTVKKLVFPWERAPTKIKISTTSLPNFRILLKKTREDSLSVLLFVPMLTSQTFSIEREHIAWTFFFRACDRKTIVFLQRKVIIPFWTVEQIQGNESQARKSLHNHSNLSITGECQFWGL